MSIPTPEDEQDKRRVEEVPATESAVAEGPSELEAKEAAELRAKSSWRRALDLSAVGIAFPIALVLGFLAGRYVGEAIGFPIAGRVVGALIGAAAGFRNLLVMAGRRGR